MTSNNFSIKPEDEYLEEQYVYHQTLIKLRWIYILFFTGAALFSAVFDSRDDVGIFFHLGLFGLIINLFTYFYAKFFTTIKKRSLTVLAIIQVMADVILASIVVYFLGGSEARTTILFAVPIIASGVLFNQWLVGVAAVLSGVGYASAVLLEHTHNGGGELELLPLLFYPITFFITAMVMSFLLKSRSKDVMFSAYKEVLAMLTHQLRHPLTTTLAIVDELVHEENISKKRQKELLNMVERVNRDGFNLVNNLLAEASHSALRHKQRINLAQAISDCVQVCGFSYKREDDVVVDLEDVTKSFDVSANPYQLSTALMNIIDNAFKYTKKSQKIQINLRNEDENIIMSIVNPLSKDKSEKVFNMFNYDSKDSVNNVEVRGNGLGLSVSRRLITNMGGEISINKFNDGVKIQITMKRIK